MLVEKNILMAFRGWADSGPKLHSDRDACKFLFICLNIRFGCIEGPSVLLDLLNIFWLRNTCSYRPGAQNYNAS